MNEENNAPESGSGNPFGTQITQYKNAGAMQAGVESREIAEVQAAMIIAQKFPRDQRAAVDQILTACTRKTLADAAIYSFPRGGTNVNGPSIRLAEVLAQNWGNMAFGIRELDQRNGESTVEAFCWDMQTNVRSTKIFQVKHLRGTKQGNKVLTDPRDIYEMVANQGSRRMRACILACIPGDVTEAALKQCIVTQEKSVGVPAEQIEKLAAAFSEYGVSDKALVRRLGHKLEVTTAAEIINLKRIYASIRDGMASASQFFEEETGADHLKEKIKAAGGSGAEASKTGQPEPVERPASASGAAGTAEPAERPADGMPDAGKTPQNGLDSAGEGAEPGKSPETGNQPDIPPKASTVCEAFDSATDPGSFADAVALAAKMGRKSRLVDEARAAANARCFGKDGENGEA